MNCVSPAPGAVLLQFYTTGRVLLVLFRGVIATLALSAGEQNVDTHAVTPRFPSQHRHQRYGHLRG